MIIAVHTTPPPTPPGNSTSTRSKGPCGLKFCMRPQLTKIIVDPKKLLNPPKNLTPNFFDPQIFDPKFFYGQVIFLLHFQQPK